MNNKLIVNKKEIEFLLFCKNRIKNTI